MPQAAMPTDIPDMLGPFRNRIVRFEFVEVGQLLAHPLNWRIHPKQQKDAVEGSLAEFGWILPILINQRTDYVVDGHLRVDVALQSGEETLVPVLWLDLSEREEKALLLLIDHLTGMAVPDADKMAMLIPDISVGDERLQGVFDAMIRDYGLDLSGSPGLDPFGDMVEGGRMADDSTLFEITTVVHGPEQRDAALKALTALGMEPTTKLVKQKES